MYTLRIINQSDNGSEERKNIFIGNEYSVLMKTPIKDENGKEWINKFTNILSDCESVGDDAKSNVVGFVFANNATYPIYDFNIVFIVNNEGKTFERIYGIYQKY